MSNQIKVGDVVPYRNTHGNIKLAEVKELVQVQSGKIWFWGIDTISKARVYRPTHISEDLIKTATK